MEKMYFCNLNTSIMVIPSNKYIIKVIAVALFSITLLFQPAFAQKQKSGNTHEFYFYEGLKLYNLQNYSQAKQMFHKVIELNPINDAAYYYLGSINMIEGDSVQAEKNLLIAVEKDPANYWYRIQLVHFYSQTDRKEVAIHMLEQLKNDYPKKSSLYFEMINLYVNEQQLDKAIETLNHIENNIGVNEATVMAKFDLLTMNNQSEQANKLIEEFAKENPSSAAANYLLGDIYANQFKDSLAIEYYHRSIAADPTYYPTYISMAEVYRMRRQYDMFFDSINPFLMAPNMSPHVKINYLQEVIFNPQFVTTFKPQVDTMVLNLFAAHPKDSTVAILVGSYYIRTGKHERGLDIIRRNMEVHPDSKGAVMEYLLILYYLERWKDLAGEGAAILKRYPYDLSITQLTGIAFWQDSLYNEAIKLFLEIEKRSEPASNMRLAAYSGLGDLYHSVGNKSKSFSYYEKAIKQDPKNLPVLNNYAYYLSLEKKKLKRAYDMSKITVDEEPNNATYLDTYGWILYLLGRHDEAKTVFKHAMIYGGKENGVILDHYAEVLYALKEFDLAFIYWDQAKKLDQSQDLAQKVANRREEMKR